MPQAEPEGDPQPRWLDTADNLASALIEGARPIRFDLARTPGEIEAAFRLRYRISAENGWLDPSDAPEGLECDEYDEHAVHVVGWDGSILAATARIVLPAIGRRLPTEAAYGIVVEPVGRVVDAGRAIVAPEYRDGEHRVLGGLSAAVWTAMTSHGYQWAAVAASRRTLDLFESLGFDVTVLGPAHAHLGEERYPARFSPPDPSLWA